MCAPKFSILNRWILVGGILGNGQLFEVFVCFGGLTVYNDFGFGNSCREREDIRHREHRGHRAATKRILATNYYCFQWPRKGTKGAKGMMDVEVGAYREESAVRSGIEDERACFV